MAMSVLVEMPRLVDAGGLLSAFTASGLRADLVDVDGQWGIEVQPVAGETEQAASEVSHLVDGWLAEHELPFVPIRVGARAFAVRPPLD